MSLDETIKEAAKALARSRLTVALTGAGISVESGIPDFRSRGGLWTRFPPEEYATISAFKRDPEKVWKMLAEMEAVLDRAEPNPAHRVLADLEGEGLLSGIITQNIDGLHQRAGSKTVVEFHGSHASLSCLSCGAAYTREEARTRGVPPSCGCGRVLKPDVIFFGEQIPTTALNTAFHLSSQCEVMLVVGTSAEVSPASEMPALAKRNRAVIIEVNPEMSRITSSVSSLHLAGQAGKLMPLLYEETLKARNGHHGKA